MSQTEQSFETIRPKYDWYETDQQVVINVLIKNMQQDDVKVMFDVQQLSFAYHKPDHESDHQVLHALNINLNGQIVPDQCTWKVGAVKAEIKMKKAANYRWGKLETDSCQTGNVPQVSMNSVSTPTTSTAKPTSLEEKLKTWDNVVKEVEKEEEENGSVDELFKKIYSQSDEATRKAMNKSFLESGGTVLSTNWNEVGAKKVEMKPPSDCEFKKW